MTRRTCARRVKRRHHRSAHASHLTARRSRRSSPTPSSTRSRESGTKARPHHPSSVDATHVSSAGRVTSKPLSSGQGNAPPANNLRISLTESRQRGLPAALPVPVHQTRAHTQNKVTRTVTWQREHPTTRRPEHANHPYPATARPSIRTRWSVAQHAHIRQPASGQPAHLRVPGPEPAHLCNPGQRLTRCGSLVISRRTIDRRLPLTSPTIVGVRDTRGRVFRLRWFIKGP